KVRSFMDSLALDRLAPLLDLDGNVTRRYAVLELPQTFFIDPQGVIRHIEHGEVLDDAAVRNGIDKARQHGALQQKPGRARDMATEFTVKVPDRPVQLGMLTSALGEAGVHLRR